MATITFKAQDELKNALNLIAKKKGITISGYIKLTLTQAIEDDLKKITLNGLTISEEIEILESAQNDQVFGPFKNVTALMKSLNKK